MKLAPFVSLSLLLACVTACPSEPGGGQDPESGGIDVPITTGESTTAPAPDPSESTASGGGGGGSGSTGQPDPDPDPDSGSSGDPTAGSSSGGNGNDVPIDCNGNVYACTDGIDNDGDGLIDLADTECTGPCDDDESSFQTGLPGDNVDCKQDCFFDGNSGQGDDGCVWDLRCDPANPGGQIGCEYTGGNNCNNQDPPDAMCLMACQPLVPPGCDCFGCCTVQTDMGPVSIFLNSGPDCALDDLAACQECSPQDDVCGNPCEPDGCELCFGETELPEGCQDNDCDVGNPCEAHGDCLLGEFCYIGCCYPAPPG